MHLNVTIKNVSWPHFSWATCISFTLLSYHHSSDLLTSHKRQFASQVTSGGSSFTNSKVQLLSKNSVRLKILSVAIFVIHDMDNRIP